MNRSKPALIAVFFVLLLAAQSLVSQELNSTFARDPGQPVDKQYSDQIRK